MSDESDESDDVSPPMAEPLLFEILRTIETAKEMPDDCPMHLQDFFAQVSAREPHAITTELLANGCSTPPACLVLRPSRTLDTAGSWACMRVHCLHIHTTARRTGQDVVIPRSAGAARAHLEHIWFPLLQVQRAHCFSHPPTRRSAVSYMAKRAAQAPRRGLLSSSPRRSRMRCASCTTCCVSRARPVTTCTHVTIRCVHSRALPAMSQCPST
jgi:hypothetical protein